MADQEYLAIGIHKVTVEITPKGSWVVLDLDGKTNKVKLRAQEVLRQFSELLSDLNPQPAPGITQMSPRGIESIPQLVESLGSKLILYIGKFRDPTNPQAPGSFGVRLGALPKSHELDRDWLQDP